MTINPTKFRKSKLLDVDGDLIKEVFDNGLAQSCEGHPLPDGTIDLVPEVADA